jgi:predicted ATPase
VIQTAGRRRILRWQVRPYDRRIPLRALSRLLTAIPGHLVQGLPPQVRDVLAELRAGRRPSAPVPVLPMQCAVLSLVRNLAEQTPLLLVVDGVQWLDLDSAQVLRFLAMHVRGLPVLVQVAAVEQRRSSAPPDGVQMCPPPLLMVRLGADRSVRRRLSHRWPENGRLS